ncbi:hypothetical protein [Bacteroides pyogenes]|uniref:hypothetical protein n=1 Tax=Bacteroides pyogenes TaxID=310300 RepID=UPI001BA4565C|nr:hypothetical protein [Bacteroides pyogenes]MDY4249210.1 hypothetical protein [Bacteroides pyogenes]
MISELQLLRSRFPASGSGEPASFPTKTRLPFEPSAERVFGQLSAFFAKSRLPFEPSARRVSGQPVSFSAHLKEASLVIAW